MQFVVIRYEKVMRLTAKRAERKKNRFQPQKIASTFNSQ